MALVVADCLTPSPRWPRGALAGLAAALKLTPALFIVYFLLRRDYKAAATMGVTFAVATGLGFLLAPTDSIRYWTSTFFNVSRVGEPENASNQSIFGVLARAGLHPGSSGFTCFWLAISVAVIAAAAVGMSRLLTTGDQYMALILNAFAILLVSPISWSHHWVWALPALLCLAVSARRLAVAGLVLFAIGPQCWLPQGGDRPLAWGPWEQVLGDSYVLCAIVVIGWFAYSALKDNVRLPGPLVLPPVPDIEALLPASGDVTATSRSRTYPAYIASSTHFTASESG
jgi:alpha-1,2-mannosyltransferase